MKNAKKPVLDLWSVSKQFGSTLAVDCVSFQVNQGEFVSVLGPSGCGKSTILKMIAGFLTPSSGQISLEGSPVENLPPERRQIGMVFQSYALFPHMTVAQNVGYGLRMRKRSKAAIKDAVEAKLDLVGLTDLADRYPDQLSGGQKQRVALARALAIEPRLLLMDEPLTALDKKIRDELRIQLRQFQQRLAIPTLFVTHDQVEALTMSDKIILINQGRIEQISTAEDLYERPETPFAAHFIGNNNEFAVKRLNETTVGIGDSSWTLDPANVVGDPKGSCRAFVRPEDLRFTTGENTLEGMCEFVSVEDSLTRYILRATISDERFSVARTRHSNGPTPKQGETVTVSFDRSSLRIMEKGRGN